MNNHLAPPELRKVEERNLKKEKKGSGNCRRERISEADSTHVHVLAVSVEN